MKKLYIDKSIEIAASKSKVWEVLTSPALNANWAGEFSPGMRLESDWKMGDPVLWKQTDGRVVVEGNVTKVEPEKFLRFTVFDVEMGRYPAAEDDGMTFELKEENGKTNLHVLHGDFSVLPEGRKYYDMTIDAWKKILPKIKEISEK